MDCIAYSVNDSHFTHLFSTIEVDFELHEINMCSSSKFIDVKLRLKAFSTEIIIVAISVQRLCTLTFFNI